MSPKSDQLKSPNLQTEVRAFLFFTALGHPLLLLCCLAWLLTATSGYAEYEIIDVSDGGTIKGQAVWKGSIPKLPPLKVFADLAGCGIHMPSPALRIDPATNGLQEVLVYLDRVERGKTTAADYPLRMGSRSRRIRWKNNSACSNAYGNRA